MKRNTLSILFFFATAPWLCSQSVATIYTKIGEVEIYLEDTMAPITAGNFIGLADQKYYDGVLIHRVVSNFVIQGGDATLTGGSKAPVIQDEFHDSLSNVKGTISMANAGPNTGSSQFFINLKDNTFLDYNKRPLTSKHPVFGHVIKGMSVVDSIGRVAKNSAGRPLQDVVMDSIRITKRYDPMASVWELDESNALKLFPNPTRGWVNVKWHTSNTYQVNIFSLDGQLVYTEFLHENEAKLDLSGLPEGVFIVELIDPSGKVNVSRISKY